MPLDERNLAYAVGLAKELHGLGTFGRDGPEFDWNYCMAVLGSTITQPDYYFHLAKVDDTYVGAVCGRVIPFHFSPRLLGIEDAWYVREGTEKRASIGMKLMMGFVKWCIDDNKAIMVQSGDIAGIRSVAVHALYRHMGFTRYGTLYKYERTT